MEKVMISQPMNGKTEEEITNEKNKAVSKLTKMGYEVVDTYFCEDWTKKENMEKEGVVNIPVKFLGKSIEAMSHCHAVYFCSGWEKARGCKIEHDIAVEYGLKIFYENHC